MCPDCKATKAISTHEIDLFKKILNDNNYPPQITYGRGCKKCNFTGFYNRVPIFEYWEKKQSIGTQLLSHPDYKDIVKIIKKSEGFEDLTTYALRLAQRGITTVEEVEAMLFGLSDFFTEDESQKAS